MKARGAGTRACRAGTHPGACARPTVIFSADHKPGADGIILNISFNSSQFDVVPDPMIVRLSLPEAFAGTVEKLIGLTGGGAFQSAEHFGSRDFRPQQHVDMISHQDPGTQIVMPEYNAAMEAVNHNLSDRFEPKIHRSRARGVQISVHPHKSLARGQFVRRRTPRVGKAAMQMACSEEPLSFGILMRQSPARNNHEPLVETGPTVSHPGSKRRDESRRGRHSCLRHEVA